jgi:hypothetical protein
MPSVVLVLGLIVGLITTPIASSVSALDCVGDCGRDGAVTIDELLTMVSVALGRAEANTCAAGDANSD